MARVHGKDVNFSYNAVYLEDELNSVTTTFEVAAYNISLPVGGAATYTATLQHSGSTTRATS